MLNWKYNNIMMNRGGLLCHKVNIQGLFCSCELQYHIKFNEWITGAFGIAIWGPWCV